MRRRLSRFHAIGGMSAGSGRWTIVARSLGAGRRLKPPTSANSAASSSVAGEERSMNQSVVPDEVDFKLEIEIEDDERELEIELKW